MSTGAVGYVTERTFDALLRAADARPWVISFVLRMFDYGPIAQRLAAIGLVTEKLESVAFVQRRFKDEAEARRIGAVLRARGLEPSGLEGEGLLTAELFVSRPEEDAAAAPLPRLVKVLSERNLNLGPRLVHVPREGRPPILVSLCS